MFHVEQNNPVTHRRVTRVIRTRSNGAISALFGLSSLEYRRIPASSAPKISRNFIRLSPIGFSDEQIVVPARQSPQVLLYVTARGLTKQERRDAVRKRGSDNSRYPRAGACSRRITICREMTTKMGGETPPLHRKHIPDCSTWNI